eukprot:m.232435 g.232435  ORF g.232435 m.232435 type:complete len:1418 (-) comp33622_c0_seq1:24-4277(-)
MSKVKWWEAVEEPTTVWRACVTEDGLDYYVNTETNQTSWDKPEELMTSSEVNDTGDWRWIPDPTEVYVPGKVIRKSGKKLEVELRDGTMRTCDESAAQNFNRTSLQRVVSDLTLLDDMSPQLILHCLKRRFLSGKIYTNIGTILISVNPYQMLDLYSPERLKQYTHRQPGQELPPHVYNIAHDAYYGITAFEQLQSVIISGESGAGKTEATKQCLQYLAAIAGSTSGVETKILKANPILEAFGNAKTIRNDNSSRFGKYIQVFFDHDDKIGGCQIESYLLEKIRVSNPSDNERNYHAFYQLCSAAPPETRTKLQLLTRPQEYKILATCVEVPTINDPRDFKELMDAFKDLAFSDADVAGIFVVLGAVLALGNVDFEEGKPDEAVITSKTQKHLDVAAQILKLDAKELAKKLVTREVRVSGQETAFAVLNVKASSENRFALSKFIYSKMFDWVVARINASFANTTEDSIFGKSGAEQMYIGILDIFGFEIFELNSLEQLCINFTNEMLQQHFNNNTFKLEAKLYKTEGIDVPTIDFVDNAPMIALLTQSNVGVLPMLDEELRIPGGSEGNFLTKLQEKQSSNAVFDPMRKLRDCFGVRHFAGAVSYNVRGFLEKNRDTLTIDLLDLLQTSTQAFMQKLYPADETLSTAQRKHSLVHQFQKQLEDLMKQLYRTTPHYIRCVKPNNEKKALTFVPRNCYDQLTYSGVFEAVAIRKQGFPFRLNHEEFASRYTKICAEEIPEGTNTRDTCMSIVNQSGLDLANVRVGSSKMLYRALEYRKLELDWSICTKNQKILDDLERLVKVETANMKREEKDAYIVELAAAVRESDLFRIHSAVAVKGRKLLEVFIEERVPKEIKKRMSIAKAEMIREELEELLELCDKEGYIIKLTRECREVLEKIIDADAALTMALAKMTEDFLERSLEMCKEFGYAGPLVSQAIRMLKGIRKSKAAINKALTRPYATAALRKAIAVCGQTGYTQAETRYSDCVNLLANVEEVENDLIEAKDSWNQKLLEAVIVKCDRRVFLGHKYRGPLEEACRDALKKVIFMNGVFKQAKERCLESQVIAAVKKGKELGIRSKDFSKLRKLVEGNYDDFLKLQYKRAKKCNEHARAIRVMVKRVDMLVNDKGSELAVKNFTGLKPSSDWAKERSGTYFGSTLIRGSGMLQYQSGDLQSPLTTAASGGQKPGVIATVHAKIFSKKYTDMFRMVQQVMGQSDASEDLPTKLHLLLQDLVTHPQMRNEAYLYIIKQTNNPPSRDIKSYKSAMPRGFALMAVLLTVFPPSKAFEGHLEFWLRQDCGWADELKRRYCLKGMVRRSVYHGASADLIPSLEEITTAIEALADPDTLAFNNILGPRLRLGEFEEPVEDELSFESSTSTGTGKGKGAWQAVVDAATQKTYYYNSETGKTQWKVPKELSASSSA